MDNKTLTKEQLETLHWAENYKSQAFHDSDLLSVRDIFNHYSIPLKKYFALCGLARHTKISTWNREKAYELIFPRRVDIERAIAESLRKYCSLDPKKLSELFKGSFFGQSKKQGVSLRMPLSTCVPTKLCAGSCYAHDALDATPNSVFRGAINGLIGALYEEGDVVNQEKISLNLEGHIKKAVTRARKEIDSLNGSWKRRPFIRFSHVGELAAFPKFANQIASKVHQYSDGEVRCVIYTRHPRAVELDPSLWVVNFTLDPSTSKKGKHGIPKKARIVFSSFNGVTSEAAQINFLEHHRWSHSEPIGKGSICPTTLPSAKDRTCDGVQCDRCFIPIE
jgi:hypothetical protein